jgi:Metallo-beta-lactamase superfamily
MNITQLRIGNVTVDSIIERDGTWRMPADLFPAYDPETARPHFAEMDDFGFDPQSGRIVITYQTFVLRTLHHTILVDTCTGEDKNYPAPMNFPKQSWLDGFARLGLGFEDIDYVFCTHLHMEHPLGGRAMGADFPKGAIHPSQTGIRLLGSRDCTRGRTSR